MSRMSAFNSPLLLGFDHFEQILDRVSKAGGDGYPPYNIEQTGEDGYVITMAVAGFGDGDLDITLKENTLVVSGKIEREDGDVTYLHHGIAGRAFERRFELADHIKVAGADLANGLLHIELVREVPEEKKPKKIAINTKAIEHKKAA